MFSLRRHQAATPSSSCSRQALLSTRGPTSFEVSRVHAPHDANAAVLKSADPLASGDDRAYAASSFSTRLPLMQPRRTDESHEHEPQTLRSLTCHVPVGSSPDAEVASKEPAAHPSSCLAGHTLSSAPGFTSRPSRPSALSRGPRGRLGARGEFRL